jgi:hypothetical protein
MPTAGTFSLKSLANGDCDFGYNVNVAGDITANKYYGDGSELTGIVSGVSEFEDKGTVTTDITLAENKITTAYFSGTNTITLPTITDTTKQVTCIFDFTTATTSQPSINSYKILTGTISVTNASATVTGAGTLFITELQVGDTISIASVDYKVSVITSDTSLTLRAVYAGTTASGLTSSKKFIRWSDKNGGKAPTTYSILGGVRNKITFKSIWEGGLLYWEAEYNSYGGVETPWTRPDLSADGTLGGASFAVATNGTIAYSRYCYYAFDNSSSTIFSMNENGKYIKMWFPQPIKISSFSINYNSGWLSSMFQIFASKDNSTYTQLLSNSTTNTVLSQTLDIPLANRDFYNYYELMTGNANNFDIINIIPNGVVIAS